MDDQIPSQPFLLRDVSLGVYRKSSVNSYLAPKNSVSHAINVNFDVIIGSGVVRPGTTLVGSTVASNKTPLGLAPFVTSGGALNLLLSVFTGASNATLYYYDTSWHASGLTALSNTAKVRFTQIGNRAFMVNGVDAMKSSADGSVWDTTNSVTTDSVTPSLVTRSKNRILINDVNHKSRVYFSSIISGAGAITYNTDATTGDWIDINPDDGSDITAFAQTSTIDIVFKTSGMYRLNVITKTVDTENIFNIGAVSQEAVVSCQGIVYFFTGIDIRSTNGDYPQQISRLGVQDFIDAIPQANWSSVAAGTDGINAYFSIGNVTIGANTDDQQAFTNVVLKFSPRDQTWSIHSYGQYQKFYALYTNSTNGMKMVGADTSGFVQAINVGKKDNTSPIFFELITQEFEGDNRAHVDKISNQIIVFCQNGGVSKLEVKEDDGDFAPVRIVLKSRVNIGTLNVESNFFSFRWYGESTGTAPVFEGIYIENIADQGLSGEEQ